MVSMMEQLEKDQERTEWESRFVVFGYILLEALEQIAAAKGAEEDAYVYANIAERALNRFKMKVTNDCNRALEAKK